MKTYKFDESHNIVKLNAKIKVDVAVPKNEEFLAFYDCENHDVLKPYTTSEKVLYINYYNDEYSNIKIGEIFGIHNDCCQEHDDGSYCENEEEVAIFYHKIHSGSFNLSFFDHEKKEKLRIKINEGDIIKFNPCINHSAVFNSEYIKRDFIVVQYKNKDH